MKTRNLLAIFTALVIGAARLEPACAQIWIQTSAPSNNWVSIAVSADGTQIVAVAGGSRAGPIYTSSDYGAAWVSNNIAPQLWADVASSADGTKLVAAAYGGQIYTSTDSGGHWTPRASNDYWQSLASSADGSRLVAVPDSGQIYTSTDSGVTWTPQESSRYWQGVASSADGTKLAASVYNGQLYTSTTTTTVGTEGSLTGDQFAALELLYIGGGQWLPLSYVGTMTPY